jgi:vacuolar-type H+-ATPase subunit D/Vma8
MSRNAGSIPGCESRVYALQDVLLPELDRTINDIETQLEELEKDEALWIRRRR